MDECHVYIVFCGFRVQQCGSETKAVAIESASPPSVLVFLVLNLGMVQIKTGRCLFGITNVY